MLFNDFWTEYPDAGLIEQFAKLRSKRGDETSSHLMWYIKLLHDPEHEYISKIPNVKELAAQNAEGQKVDKKSQREKILYNYFGLKSTDLSSTLFKEASQWYVDYYMPVSKRVLNIIQQRLFEAEHVLRGFTINTTADISTFVDHTEDYNKFKKLLDDAQANFNEDKKRKLKGFGGKQVSAFMDGSLFKTDSGAV